MTICRISILAGLAVAIAHPFRCQDRWSDIVTIAELALAVGESSGDDTWQAKVHYDLGDAYFMTNRFAEARRHAQESELAARKVGDRHGEAAALSLHGFVLQHMECLDEAIGYHQRALRIQQEIGDTRGQALTLTGLGVGYHVAGRFDEAVAAHEQALMIDSYPHLRGIALFRLGDAHLDADRPGNDGFTYGWMAAYPLRSVLEHAAAEGDLTRANIRAAVEQVSVNYEGALPDRSYGGDPNQEVVRGTTIGQPDREGTLGLTTIEEHFVGSVSDAYDWQEPCQVIG
jgi:tetratricopeptide (TPR) repeat protein